MIRAKVQQHHVCDFVLTSPADHANPFDVRLSATFRCEGSRLRVGGLPGFHDGGRMWKVRFCPPAEGKWAGLTRSDDPALDGVPLAVTCVPNRDGAVHGLLGVDPIHRHRLTWSDGTPLVPLGFELDWLAAFHQRLGQPKGRPVNRKDDRFEPAMDLLVRRGFNYLVSCVYAHNQFTPAAHPYAFTPPEMFCFGGTNEAPDHSVLNVKFFQDFDRAVAALHRRGVVLNLMFQVLNKEVNWPAPRSAEDDTFWRYVVARYQAFGNIVWDVAKEGFRYVRADPAGGEAYIRSRMELIRRHDVYHHLVTAHDNVLDSYGCHSDIDRICDLVSDQVHLWRPKGLSTVQIAWEYNREAIRRCRSLAKPYINIEYGYERGVEPIPAADLGRGTTSGQEILLWTYALYAGGAFANYYYNNTSWNLVKFHPEPPSWRRYRYLRDLLEMMDLRPMAPDNEISRRGMCLAQPGRQYFIFLPEGGDDTVDLACACDAGRAAATWMDIFTGRRVGRNVGERSFATPLVNPLRDKAAPCAVYIRVET